MPEFVNTNPHYVYVQDPDYDPEKPDDYGHSVSGDGLVRIPSGEKVTATGRFADNLDATGRVERVSSDEGKAYLGKEERVVRELIAAGPGDKAFPANEPEYREAENRPEAAAQSASATGSARREELERMKVPALRKLARDRGVDLPKKAKKEDLVDALASAEGPDTGHSAVGGTATTQTVPTR